MDEATAATLADALLRTGRGDRRAFRSVYHLTAAKLLGVCLRICGERGAAEDVLQDVFVTVWLRANRYDPNLGSAMSWLATMARRRSLDWRRSYQPTSGSNDMLEAIVDPSPSAVDHLLLTERDLELQVRLDALVKPQRDAIRTAFFDEVTYVELAERSTVPVGTMKSRVRRGLLQLRESLKAS